MLQKLSNCFRLCSKRIFTDIQKRYLFSPAILGTESFKNVKDRYNAMRRENKDLFLSKMEKEMANHTFPFPVLVDDLMCLIHLCEDKDRELALLPTMIKKFVSENNSLTISKYDMGPRVMKMLYILNRPDLAFEFLMDKENGEFFCQLQSFIIGMDLLFKQGHYDLVIKLFHTLLQVNKEPYPRDATILAIAACIKINTSRSYEYCLYIIDEMEKVGKQGSNRFYSYISYLAIKQGDIEKSLELLELLKFKRTTYWNLKILAFLKQGKILDSIGIIKDIVNKYSHENIKVLNETLSSVQEVYKAKTSEERFTDFSKFCQYLQDNDFIVNIKLEDFIFKEIKYKKPDYYQHALDTLESPEKDPPTLRLYLADIE